MSKSELEVNKGLEIIGAVYDSLNKFKYEEDKRMVGYVVINNLLSSKQMLFKKNSGKNKLKNL